MATFRSGPAGSHHPGDGPWLSPAPPPRYTKHSAKVEAEKLAYQMTQVMGDVAGSCDRLAQLAERDAAREVRASCDLSEAMGAMQAAIDNAIRMLTAPTEETELARKLSAVRLDGPVADVGAK